MSDNALVAATGSEYRQSTDAAGLCKEIVIATASKIGGKSYVGVEGWQAIAVAHGCAASADNVERVTDEGMSGFKAIGVVRRMSDGVEIARAEGFLGDDETTWAKRPVYARRAMVQTRAISRACRSAFAHVVVMMKAGLSTTPAEEVPYGGFEGNQQPAERTIEAKPAKRVDPPFPEGPARNITALKDMGRTLWAKVKTAEDGTHLGSMITENAALITQLQEALPDWWKGGRKVNRETGEEETYEGLGQVIERMEADFGGEYQSSIAGG